MYLFAVSELSSEVQVKTEVLYEAHRGIFIAFSSFCSKKSPAKYTKYKIIFTKYFKAQTYMGNMCEICMWIFVSPLSSIL